MIQTRLTAQSSVSTLRIIFGGMLLGVLSFAALVVFLARSKSIAGERETALLLVLLGLALALSVAYPIVRRISLSQLRRRVRGDTVEDAEPKIAAAFASLSIVGMAMIEAPTLFATTIFLLSGDKLALLAVGLGVIVLLAQWPSEERYRRFAAETAGHDPA